MWCPIEAFSRLRKRKPNLSQAAASLFAALGVLSTGCYAEAWYCRPDARAFHFCITGRITESDAVFAQNFAERYAARNQGHPHARPLVTLDSEGGDILAAIQIGRTLRSLRALAIIPEGSQCLSACVFVLAGATYRASVGAIGIHRPYFSDTQDVTYAEAQARYRRLQAIAKVYLDEMNMPARLLDAMVSVPPDSVRILTADEKATFGLRGFDPAEEEIQDAEEARQYEISKEELYARRQRAYAECRAKWDAFVAAPGRQTAAEHDRCKDAIMRGFR